MGMSFIVPNDVSPRYSTAIINQALVKYTQIELLLLESLIPLLLQCRNDQSLAQNIFFYPTIVTFHHITHDIKLLEVVVMHPFYPKVFSHSAKIPQTFEHKYTVPHLKIKDLQSPLSIRLANNTS